MHVIACRWDEVALRSMLSIPGVEVTLVMDEWEFANRRLAPELLERVRAQHVVPSFTDLGALSALAAALGRQEPAVEAVFSLAEYSQLGAAYLAQALGLAEPEVRTSIRVRDKAAMKAAAVAAGVPCARQRVVEDRSAAGLDRIGAELGWPLVLKPLDGMGTVDTWVVADSDEAANRLLNTPETVMIAEEYVRGEEFHVDAVWIEGKAMDFSVGRYPVPRVQIVDPGHLNGSGMLREAEHERFYSELRDLSARVNAAIGVQTGITHTEFFLTEAGSWVFSEVATRPGGGAIPEMFAYFGDDLRSRWLLSVLGRGGDVRRDEQGSPVFGWGNYAPSAVGRVSREPDEAALRSLPFVVDVKPGHRVGDTVHAVFPSLWSWQVVFGADTWEEFLERMVEVERHVSFELEPAGGDAGA
ncbi:MAG TPA: ATP-grasp domain-containing protein [Humibacillus xanthopallidus]|nr:ATP-grasp domain-containing protein [Humibacillus xanthopallidus]